jgi:diguanylate cyclase (GGDEF)-like protein
MPRNAADKPVLRARWLPRSRAGWRDVYIGGLTVGAGAALWFALTHPTADSWSAPGVLALIATMVIAERLEVPLPRSGAVSIATIPHMMAVLLLPPWLSISASAIGMLVDQGIGRTGLRRTIFNTASVMLTVGISSQLADWVELDTNHLGRPDQWLQVPAFLVVSAAYYTITNVLVSTVASLSSGTPIRQTLFDNAIFAVPAELAMCGIGGLIALLWIVCPPWAPIILFPTAISQVALTYISRSQRAAEQLRHQARHDILTGLPNRASLMLRLEDLLGSRSPWPFALLLIDLDRFKEVNDTFGHQAGDLLLREIGPRLTSALKDTALLARLGGDEFAVLLPSIDAMGAVAAAKRLLRTLDGGFAVDGHMVYVGGSIGIATYPADGSTALDLLRCADVAMYAAKRGNLGVSVYTLELDENNPSQVSLYGELRQAIEHADLRLHFQPKFEVGSGALAGVEALVRWQHGERGLLAPCDFIPLAERTGLIKPLGRWVLQSAVRQARVWHDSGLDVEVAVNLTTADLQDPNLAETILELLGRWSVPPQRLRIEITETTLMADAEHARRVLEQLRNVGIHVSIDDFGTGYSSLAYLKRLPADELKIDKSFVQQVATDAGDAAIVRSVVALGHELGLAVTAEGVERPATLDRLRAFGCDKAQGYLLGKPMEPDSLLEFARGLSARVPVVLPFPAPAVGTRGQCEHGLARSLTTAA